MKKRVICLAVIVIALLTCGIIYFQPLSLSDIAGEGDQVKIVYCELGVRNGEAYVDPVDYQRISPRSKSVPFSPYWGNILIEGPWVRCFPRMAPSPDWGARRSPFTSMTTVP